MRCKDATNPKSVDDGREDDVVGRKERRGKRRETCLWSARTWNVKLQEGSSFIVYSGVQEASAVTLKRSSLPLLVKPFAELSSGQTN